jgi:hypothetical protein
MVAFHKEIPVSAIIAGEMGFRNENSLGAEFRSQEDWSDGGVEGWSGGLGVAAAGSVALALPPFQNLTALSFVVTSHWYLERVSMGLVVFGEFA